MQEKIVKLVKNFLDKYERFNVETFLQFVRERIPLDSQGVGLIREKIEQFGIQGDFDEDTFRLLLKLVSAAQKNSAKASKMSRSEIEQFKISIAFNSKKNKNQNDTEPKQSKQSQQLIQQSKSCEQIPTKKQDQQIKSQTEIKYPVINISKSQQTKKKQPRNQKRKLSAIEQVDNSSQINLNNLPQQNQPKFMDLGQSRQEQNTAKITQYEKLSADYMNPVIKFTIIYKNNRVLRRFSEFQKLINILRQKYEGFILPKLPPKEGIKAGINYFWGIDEAFLQERKKKLQQMVNRLLSNKIISDDTVLQKFLTDQYFEIEFNKESYASYFKSITDVVFNAKQLKDFGVAYYNYLKEKGNVKLDSEIENKYLKISQMVEIFTALDNYRKKINANFDKRRQIIYDLSIKCRNPQKSGLDKMMDLIGQEIQDLKFEIENYKDLKSQESWILQLMKQKQGDGQRTLYELKQQHQKLKQRLKNIEKNLRLALEDFYQAKQQDLKTVSDKILCWRENVHP